MMPVTVVETFPENGDDKIFELRFGNIQQAAILRQYGSSLAEYVRRNAEAAGGDNDAEILISLAEHLIGACDYDGGSARAISEYGAQNIAATAYGALVNGSAVGEGFAMAYKALCDELGFDCQVILGYIDGMIHAWNIVSLYGDYYHIDISMCAVNGMETAFMKTDADFGQFYEWDTENTVICTGELTYEEFVIVEEPQQEDEPDETGDDEQEGEPGETGESEQEDMQEENAQQEDIQENTQEENTQEDAA